MGVGGTHANVPDRASCLPCDGTRGEYSEEASDSCVLCSPNQIPTVQLAGCMDCPMGSVPDQVDRTKCVECGAVGFVEPNRTRCELCSSGTVPTGDGLGCTPCGEGFISAAGDLTSTACPPGRFENGNVACVEATAPVHHLRCRHYYVGRSVPMGWT